MPSSGLARLVLREYWRRGWGGGPSEHSLSPSSGSSRPKPRRPPRCWRPGRHAGCAQNPDELWGEGFRKVNQASGLRHCLDSDLPVLASPLSPRPPAPWPSLGRPKPGSSSSCRGHPEVRDRALGPCPSSAFTAAREQSLGSWHGATCLPGWVQEGRAGTEPGPSQVARRGPRVGRGRRLTVNRPFFSGVEGCSLRSSVCGSWTFSMPAPSSSFFSKAE